MRKTGTDQNDHVYCVNCRWCHVQRGELCHCHKAHWSDLKLLRNIQYIRRQDCPDYEDMRDDVENSRSAAE